MYPGLLQIAAHAHAAVGFLDRDPAQIQTATALLRAAPGPASAESLVLRGVCNVLMGATDEAIALLQAARKWVLPPAAGMPLGWCRLAAAACWRLPMAFAHACNTGCNTV